MPRPKPALTNGAAQPAPHRSPLARLAPLALALPLAAAGASALAVPASLGGPAALLVLFPVLVAALSAWCWLADRGESAASAPAGARLVRRAGARQTMPLRVLSCLLTAFRG